MKEQLELVMPHNSQLIKEIKIELWKQKVRDFIAYYPDLFFLAGHKINGFNPEANIVKKDTQIVIEGCPGSANTFAVRAFLLAQEKDVKMARHTHKYTQVIVAARMGIPALVLVRNPKDSIMSYLVRFSNYQKLKVIDVERNLRRYIEFHLKITPYIDECVIADFSTVTNDFGSVISRVNNKFCADFSVFNHNEENTQACFAEMHRRTKHNRDLLVAIPSEKRRQEKEKIRKFFQDSELTDLLIQAEELYQMFRSKDMLLTNQLVN